MPLTEGFDELFVEFAQELRSHGMLVGSDDVITFCNAVSVLDGTDVMDVYWGGRTTLVRRKENIPVYNEIFQRFFFDNLEEEDDSKVDQIVRIIQYLKTLPVKTVSLPGVEADDIIAYLSSTLPTKPEDRVFIVSSDKDYLQLVTEQVIVYRPVEKEYYTTDTVKEKFNVPPHNFLLYKLLMGDNSDGITGIKGLGPKGLFKKIPRTNNTKSNIR